MTLAWLDTAHHAACNCEDCLRVLAPRNGRKRRADIREALTAAQETERNEWILAQIREADSDAEMAVIDAVRLGHDDSESCVHCSAMSRASQLRLVAARWTQILNGEFEPRPHSPRVQYTWMPDTQEWALTDDSQRLPDFDPLDFDGMRPEMAQRLVRFVSDARNWVHEPTGVSQVDVVHHGKAGGKPRIEVKKPRETRTYPGCHWINPKPTYDSKGRRHEPFARTAVLTCWSTRKGWCVYVCEQGPKRGQFDTWIPTEWWHDLTWARRQDGTPVQIPVTDEFYESYLSDDIDHLDRALEVAYLKAAEIRQWMGEMAPFESPLPFSPERLEVIGHAQVNEFERRRVTSEPADD